MHLIDSHCHLDFPVFDDDRSEILKRCRAEGIRQIIVPAVEAKHFDRVVNLCKQQPGLYPALGLHPMFIDEHLESDLLLLRERAKTDHPVAIGEIGLDYFVKDLDKEEQQHFFEQQLGIAQDAGLPVILHIRKAHDQVLHALRRIQVRGGIAHAFSGSLQQAQQYIDLGFKLGFGGMLTYERSTKLRNLAKALPLEAIVLETDAPDMTVAAHRGERNSPEYLVDCLAALAEVRQEAADQVAEQTTRNLLGVLDLPG
jgi:TatD DNase family protein